MKKKQPWGKETIMQSMSELQKTYQPFGKKEKWQNQG